MPRLQLSINVSDLDAAVSFYTRLFGAEPAKLRPGYATFAIDDPPLKLVLNAKLTLDIPSAALAGPYAGSLTITYIESQPTGVAGCVPVGVTF